VLALLVSAVFVDAKHHLKALSQEIIDEVNSKETSWKAGHNLRFKAHTEADVKKLCGSLSGGPKAPIKEIPVGDVPASFDSRTQWPNCKSVQMVRDQGDCGSCWAFGAAEAMSDRICIASKGADQTLISANDLVSCCHTCGQGCNGGYPAAAWAWYEHDGVVTGGLYHSNVGCQPYVLPPCEHHTNGTLPPCTSPEDKTPACEKKCISGYPKTYEADKNHGVSHFGITGVSQIQTEIMTNGPVEAAFTVYADFPSYKSGVYQHTTGGVLGGHAIKLIGWGTLNGVDYWTVANSWNADWGMNGFFLIRRGVDECGIEDGVVAGMPKLS